ncbi:hypothetical protein V8C35DRAFT_285026 [Trichoderma chlorosporum]
MSSQYKKTATSSRFVLPALNLNFGSITDGTDIPPPPESPIEPNTPSKTSKGSNQSAETKENINLATYENKAGVRSVAENAPPSPVASSQQETITQESVHSIVNAYRPVSQSGSSAVESEKTKRASGWFKRRLRSGDNQSRRRSSLLGLEQHIPASPRSTADNKPAPMIPKLVHLESDKNAFGSNLFDHIK